MQLISRSDARRSGLKHYFTGKPCKHGHIAARFVVNTTCLVCATRWKTANPDKVKAYTKEYCSSKRKELASKSKDYSKTDAGRATRKRFREKHCEKRSAYGKAYRETNKELIRSLNKKWRDTNKDKMRDYGRQYSASRRAADPSYKLAVYLRGRVSRAIRRGQKGGSMVRDLGCSIEFLVSYLESQFKPGMSWDNWAVDGWHIDHKIPLASFDLTIRSQFLKACHFTNLQPLWSEENLRKGATMANVAA